MTEDTMQEILYHHRARLDFKRARDKLTLQIKAINRRWVTSEAAPEELTRKECTRRAEVLYKDMMKGRETELAQKCYVYCLPFIAAREAPAEAKKEQEKMLVKAAEKLPVHDWWVSCPGRASPGLGLLVGEAGRDLSCYPHYRMLWKRYGLAVIDERCQRKATGEEGIRQGYNPSRRSVVWTIGNSLWKQQGPYRDIFLARREYEWERNPEMSKGYNLSRAQRYMEKVLVRDLWREWTGKAGLEVLAA